ncbi:Cytochrome bd-II ubiquinol oxidase subunit 1 [Bienertia sinuspersici]
MAVDLHFEESLLRQLKPEDPWLPPKPWESVLSENGASYSPSSNHASLDCCLYDLSSVSEASLVRLVLNALQGVQSAVLSIEKLSALFCADPADRSSHRIPTLWNRSLSTCALGKMLKSIGCSGSLLYSSISTMEIGQGKPGHEGENMKEAFAVAVRQCWKPFGNVSAHKRIANPNRGIGHLCHLSDSALCFSTTSFGDVVAKAFAEIRKFPWGGNLLTYLYTELQVVDPAHCSLLKFLFNGHLSHTVDLLDHGFMRPKLVTHMMTGIPADFPLASVREQDGVSIPCFLRDVLVPLLRAGQQLQMVMKLLRLCNYVHAGEDNFEDILPGSSDFCSNEMSGSPLSFNREEIEAIVLSRKNYYCKMQEKLDKFMGNLDIKDSEVSSTEDDFSYVQEPSDCSSTEGSDEQVNAGRPIHLMIMWQGQNQIIYLLCVFLASPLPKPWERFL